MYHIGVIMPSDPQQHIMQYQNRAAWNQVRWVIQIIQATIQLQTIGGCGGWTVGIKLITVNNFRAVFKLSN